MELRESSTTGAGAGVVLDYAGAWRARWPIRSIVGASLVFAGVAWVVDCILTYYYFLGSDGAVRSAGRAGAIRGLRLERFVISQLFEAAVMLVVALLVMGAQCLVWRMRPVERPRRVLGMAVILGVLYCGHPWGMFWLADYLTVLSSEAWQLGIALMLGIIAGMLLGWRRSSTIGVATIASASSIARSAAQSTRPGAK